jgi:hypothetical protein
MGASGGVFARFVFEDALKADFMAALVKQGVPAVSQAFLPEWQSEPDSRWDNYQRKVSRR